MSDPSVIFNIGFVGGIHKQILIDVLCNKYSSFSLSYLCKGADVLLTKHTCMENIYAFYSNTMHR